MTTGQAPKKRSTGPTLAICTPWRDHLELADDYFAAIDVDPPDQLIVVDDGSETPLGFAAARIEQGGFSTASNAALALAETDHVLFLNNDIKATKPNWLTQIRKQITAGVLVGRLIYRNKFGVVDHPYIDGWCLGMTTEDARRLGGWDERYDEAGPGYFSDNALCLVARSEGMVLRELLPRPGLLHKGGSTGGTDLALFQHALQVNGALFEAQVKELVG